MCWGKPGRALHSVLGRVCTTLIHGAVMHRQVVNEGCVNASLDVSMTYCILYSVTSDDVHDVTQPIVTL